MGIAKGFFPLGPSTARDWTCTKYNIPAPAFTFPPFTLEEYFYPPFLDDEVYWFLLWSHRLSDLEKIIVSSSSPNHLKLKVLH